MEEVRSITRKVALALGTVGLMNLQLAYKDGKVYMLEANPRASRTVPIVSKATGVPLAKVATKVMLGRTLKELGLKGEAAHGAFRGQGVGVPVPEAARGSTAYSGPR